MSPVGRPWRVLGRRSLFSTPRGLEVAVEAVELPSGDVVDDYYQIEKPATVLVAPLTADGRLLTLRQYFHGARRAGYAVPGGAQEAGETPLATARRELLEETGHIADDWRDLGDFVRDGNQGYGHEHIFIAQGCRPVAAPASGDLEDAEVVALTLDEARALLAEGAVPVVSHAAAMALALLQPR